MVSTYQTHQARLRVTGGGLQDEADASCYVHSSGPDASTPLFAQNLWQQICGEWPFFPRFHQHLGSRPNVSPVVITTAIGPAGQETVWMQPCRSAPQPASASNTPNASAPTPPAPVTTFPTPSPTPTSLPAPTAARSTPSSGRGFAADVTNTIATPSASSLSRSQSVPNTRQVAAAIQSASSSTPKRPRSVADVVVVVAEQTLSSLRRKTLQDNLLASRTALLAEFNAQIWTKEQFQRRVRRLEADYRCALRELEDGADAGEVRPSKRTRHSSPDWDSDLALSSSDEADS